MLVLSPRRAAGLTLPVEGANNGTHETGSRPWHKDRPQRPKSWTDFEAARLTRGLRRRQIFRQEEDFYALLASRFGAERANYVSSLASPCRRTDAACRGRE